jgi:hypothetical protein
MLASITDTIIPAGNSIGALSVGVDKFLQKLIDDCYEKDVQDNVKTQLKLWNSAAKTTYKSHLRIVLNATRRIVTKTFHVRKKEEKDFFDLVKSETIRGFNTSQKVMQEYLGYKVAPGHYYGCMM